MGFTPLPKEFPRSVGGNLGALTPGTLKKGEGMEVVVAIATAILAVVAVLEFIRRKGK